MLIIAHRGASGEFPEGSQLAYEQALTEGADGFECDLRLTKDNKIICFHDSNTKRLFGVDLDIARNTYAQLNQIAPIFLFEELLKLAIINKKHLMVEFKHPVPTAARVEKLTHKLLKKYEEKIENSEITIILVSFSYFATLLNLILAKGLYQCGLVIKNTFYAKINPTKILVVDIKLLRHNSTLITKLKKRSKKIYFWTVNNEADIQLCSKIQPEGIITDYPSRIRFL